jgi:hypothetical protein
MKFDPRKLNPGDEHWEKFTRKVGKEDRTFIQYDYRMPEPDCELFSAIAPTLELCKSHVERQMKLAGKNANGG